MLERSMKTYSPTMNSWPIFVSIVNKSRNQCRTRSNPENLNFPSVLISTDESGNIQKPKKSSGSHVSQRSGIMPNSLSGQESTIGVIGGASILTTLVFLEKIAWWSSKDGKGSVPLIVCSDPALSKELMVCTPFNLSDTRDGELQSGGEVIVENLQSKRLFLEQTGAGCIVMPCHLSHIWHKEISRGCSLPFFHVAECLAIELKKAKLKPLEAGSKVRIGLIGTDAILMAGFYQEKLQKQGYEAVLPDKATMEHIIIPAIDAFARKDMEGARNLLRIAIQVLLIKAINKVILASNEIQGLLPHDDPLLKKCIDPMDALVRATVAWVREQHKQTEA